MQNECTSCELHKSASKMVHFKGPEDSPFVIIGEAPGAEEDKLGIPFVGDAGQVLDETLLKVFGADFDIHPLITNTVACRPPGNMKPKLGVVSTCAKKHLWPLLRKHPRTLVMCLGTTAWSALYPIPHRPGMKKKGIRSVSGTIIHQPNIPSWLIPTFHPAAGFYSPASYEPMVQAFYTAKRLLVDGIQTIDYAKNIHVYADLEEAVAAIDAIPDGSLVILDIETTGLNPRSDALTMFGLCYGPDKPIIIVHWEVIQKAHPFDTEVMAQALYRLFKRCKLEGHNIKFDGKFIHAVFGEVDAFLTGWSGDSMIKHFLSNENLPHGLKPCSCAEFGTPDYEIELYNNAVEEPTPVYKSWTSFPVGGLPMYVPTEKLVEYNAADTITNWLLTKKFDALLKEQQLEWVYHHINMPLVPILAKAETRGILLDKEWLDKYGDYVDEVYNKLLEGFATIREDFNPTSDKQVRELLFEQWKCPTTDIRRTPTGLLSVDEENLRVVVNNLPGGDTRRSWIQAVIRIRIIAKIRGTYIHGLRQRTSKDHSIHTSFLMAPAPEETGKEAGGAATGRLSSVDPNLQNQPLIIAPLFKAREGYNFVEADYTQTEVKGLALYSGDPVLLHAVRSEDAHSEMVKAIWPEEYGKLSAEEIKKHHEKARTNAKTALFRTQYGGGPGGMARQLGISFEEAVAIQNQVFGRIPKAVAWMDSTKNFVRKHGYVVNYFHRRRRIPTIWSHDEYARETAERQAVNSPIQGLGADITYLGIINTMKMVAKKGWKEKVFFLVTVHDSALFEVHDSVLEEFVQALPEAMTITLATVDGSDKVEFGIDLKVGKRWKGEPSLEALKEYILEESQL